MDFIGRTSVQNKLSILRCQRNVYLKYSPEQSGTYLSVALTEATPTRIAKGRVENALGCSIELSLQYRNAAYICLTYYIYKQI